MCHLLVTSKRHLPGWKTKEHDASCFQETFHKANQLSLVMNMLDHIFQHNDIKSTPEVLFPIDLVNIFWYKPELSRCQVFRQIGLCNFNPGCIQLHPHSLAAFIDKCF